MSGIRIVTKSDCPFCSMAKSWLKEHSFDYNEELIDNEEERLAFYQTINGATEVVGELNTRRVNSVPQIFIDDKHVATGHAEEKRNSSKINQTSALENSETSSCGRALAFLGFISDGIASAEEVSAAIVQQDNKVQTALKELEAVSHKGSYQEWLSKNKPMLSELKLKNPIAYATFMEDFQSYKTNLQTKGVI